MEQPQEKKQEVVKKANINPDEIVYRQYKDESDIEVLMDMIAAELSEPYSIYTYRYFFQNWPELTTLAFHNDRMIGIIIGKLELHKNTQKNRGYVAMIVVLKEYRGLKIGYKMTQMFIDQIAERGGEEIVLETEAINYGALKLYKKCGFSKVKRLMNYYLNGNDAYRLKLWIKQEQPQEEEEEVEGEKGEQQQQDKKE